jgi:hypothetical protein
MLNLGKLRVAESVKQCKQKRAKSAPALQNNSHSSITKCNEYNCL